MARYPSWFSRLFRSLQSRNLRLFFLGQGISLIGTWMQQVAAGWLAYELTAGEPAQVRAFWLGFVGFSSRIPTFFLAPIAGVLVDRWNRHKLIMVTQVLAMLQACILAGLTLTHTINLGLLIAISLVLGIINSLDVPARQSFMVEMLDGPEYLNNAIALNSSLVNGARIIGPSVAGVLLHLAGAGFCFAFNALSYVAVVVALLAMTVRPSTRKRASGHVLLHLKEGFRYAFGFPPVRDILLLVAVTSLCGASYVVLLPIVAEQILGGGSALYAALFATAGAGALFAAILLAMRPSPRGLTRWIAAGPCILGVGLIGLGLSRWPWISLAVMPVIGFGTLVQMASSNTMIQTLVDDHMRGRAMSFYSMAFMGTVPIGSLIAGLMARAIGAPAALCLNGCLCMVGSLVFAVRLKSLREHIRPVYVRKGIIS